MSNYKITLPSNGAIRQKITFIYPRINAGKYATKSVQRQKIYASADNLIDRHDIVSRKLLYQHRSVKLWNECIMHRQGNDKFGGEFVSEIIGFYFFKIEPWVDHFVRWQNEVYEKIKAELKSPCS